MLIFGAKGVQLRDSKDRDIGVQLVRLGVPPDKVLNEYELLQQVTDEVAGRFADLFQAYILPNESDPSGRLGELVRLAGSVVELSLIESLKREGER